MGLFRVNITNNSNMVKNPKWQNSSASIFLFVLKDKNK